MALKWSLSTNFFVLSLCLLAYLAWQTEATKNQIDGLGEASKQKRPVILKCHVCHSETNDGCFNLTESESDDIFSKECAQGQNMCVVKKFAFTSTYGNGTTSPMKTFSVKRNCTDKCDDGCVVMGERTRLYVCSQCCTEELCNVGSGSSSLHNKIDNSFQRFITSVAHVHLFPGTFHHLWHAVEMLFLLSFHKSFLIA